MASKTEQRLAALHAVETLTMYRMAYVGFSRRSGRRYVTVTPQQTRALNYLVAHRLALPDVDGGPLRLLRLTTVGEKILEEWRR